LVWLLTHEIDAQFDPQLRLRGDIAVKSLFKRSQMVWSRDADASQSPIQLIGILREHADMENAWPIAFEEIPPGAHTGTWFKISVMYYR
jgi:hypothetical protein